MSKDLQELVYDEVVRIFNDETTPEIEWQGGYDFTIYNGIPFVIDTSDLERFAFERKEVIPIAQSFSNETPTTYTEVDRSDFVLQLEILFRLEALDDVKTAIQEYVTYMKANKNIVLDGYKIGFRVSRGEKQATWTMDGGSFYGRYRLMIYYTAIENGYIFTSNDKWEMKLATELDTSYVRLKEIQDNMANSGNALPDNETKTIKHYNTSSAWTNKFQVFYDGSTTSERVYDWASNKFDETFKLNTEFTVKETFNSNVRTWNVIITGAARTKTDNGVAILEFDVREV